MGVIQNAINKSTVAAAKTRVDARAATKQLKIPVSHSFLRFLLIVQGFFFTRVFLYYFSVFDAHSVQTLISDTTGNVLQNLPGFKDQTLRISLRRFLIFLFSFWNYPWNSGRSFWNLSKSNYHGKYRYILGSSIF